MFVGLSHRVINICERPAPLTPTKRPPTEIRMETRNIKRDRAMRIHQMQIIGLPHPRRGLLIKNRPCRMDFQTLGIVAIISREFWFVNRKMENFREDACIVLRNRWYFHSLHRNIFCICRRPGVRRYSGYQTARHLQSGSLGFFAGFGEFLKFLAGFPMPPPCLCRGSGYFLSIVLSKGILFDSAMDTDMLAQKPLNCNRQFTNFIKIFHCRFHFLEFPGTIKKYTF